MISLNISEEILVKHIKYLLGNGLEERIRDLITDDIVNFDSGEQDDSNDINSPESDFLNIFKSMFEDSSNFKANNDNHH